MRLELEIKRKAFLAIESVYGENALDIFINFFNNKRRAQRYTNDRHNKLASVIHHPKWGQLKKN